MNHINIQEQKEQIVNGVNVSKLFETVGVIKEKPDIAKFNFKQKVNGLMVDIIVQLLTSFMVHVRISKEVNPLSLKKMNLQYY